jgi:phage shock protein A
MSLLKRLSVTLFSRIDGVVADIENHDALIKVALEEQSQKIVNAKGQLLKLKRKQQAIEKSIAELIKSQQSWEARAVTEASNDQQRALQCLQRKQQVTQALKRQQQSLSEFNLMIDKLATDIRNGELELQQIKQKREMLSARQSSAEMAQSIHYNQQSNLNQLHDTFDRWEANLETRSIANDSNQSLVSILDGDDLRAGLDSFEKEFLDQEKQAELESELAELLAGNKQAETSQDGKRKSNNDIEEKGHE